MRHSRVDLKRGGFFWPVFWFSPSSGLGIEGNLQGFGGSSSSYGGRSLERLRKVALICERREYFVKVCEREGERSEADVGV